MRNNQDCPLKFTTNIPNKQYFIIVNAVFLRNKRALHTENFMKKW